MENLAIWFQQSGQVTLAPYALPTLRADQVQVATTLSAISMGTEKLLLSGKTEIAHEEIHSWPFRYGYQNVGTIFAIGSDVNASLLGRRVFSLKPHQQYYHATTDELWFLPADVSDEQAAYSANMETAVTFVLDAAPLIGERIAIHGFGILGLCTALILRQSGYNDIHIFEPSSARAHMAQELGFIVNPSSPISYDLQFELSGQQETLSKAIELACFAGRLVIGSWYAEEGAVVKFGGNFHKRRLTLISSQVSTFGANYSLRYDRKRRRELTMCYLPLLPNIPYQRVQPSEAPQAYARLLKENNLSPILIQWS